MAGTGWKDFRLYMDDVIEALSSRGMRLTLRNNVR